MASSSISLFDLALAAANKRGPKFPARLVLPAIQEAVTAAADALKDKRRNPLEAFAELSLLQIVANYTEAEGQATIQRALGRIPLDEAKIFRALGRSERFSIADRFEYFERAVKIIECFVGSNQLSPGDRASLKRDSAAYRLDHCDLLTTRVNRGLDSSTCEDPQHARDYYNLRGLVFSVLETLYDLEISTAGGRNEQTVQLRERTRQFCTRKLLTCPSKTAISRRLAIEQNLDLLQNGIYKDLLAVRAALNQNRAIYGASTALTSNYIGYNEQLGMFLLFPVISYLNEKLRGVGEVVGISIPYTQGGQKTVDDFDVVFKVTKKSNPFGFEPALYFAEIKATLGTIPFATNVRAQREMHTQLRGHDKERQRLIKYGLPAKSRLALIEFYPDETRYHHQNARLDIGIPHITIRAPIKGGPGLAIPPVIDENGIQTLVDENVSTDGLIQRLREGTTA